MQNASVVLGKRALAMRLVFAPVADVFAFEHPVSSALPVILSEVEVANVAAFSPDIPALAMRHSVPKEAFIHPKAFGVDSSYQAMGLSFVMHLPNTDIVIPLGQFVGLPA